LHLLSLVLNFIGSICLGYDLLSGFPKRNLRDRFRTQLEGLQSTIVYLEQSVAALPSQYTEADRQSMIADYRARFASDGAELTTKLNKLGPLHEAFSFLLGIILLSGGFLLDAISSLIERWQCG